MGLQNTHNVHSKINKRCKVDPRSRDRPWVFLLFPKGHRLLLACWQDLLIFEYAKAN